MPRVTSSAGELRAGGSAPTSPFTAFGLPDGVSVAFGLLDGVLDALNRLVQAVVDGGRPSVITFIEASLWTSWGGPPGGSICALTSTLSSCVGTAEVSRGR
jgi:hypothetical protein